MRVYPPAFALTKEVFLVCILLLGTTVTIHAQTIKGIVTGNDKKPIGSANILLLKAKDSSLVKGMVSDNNGRFSFTSTPAGNYKIQISFSGYEEMFSASVTVDKEDIDLGFFQLKEINIQLEKVTVTSKRPLFEQKIDRMVINVRNSITASGGTALDILERSPGVIVDRQNNSISINGKDGVVIMINGKINQMPLEAVVQMLSGMNAGNIEKIELITTPPANFDAGGNAGFINIVLINNPNQGLNGSYSATVGYGLGERTLGNLNFNYRHNKMNLYGDYAFSRNCFRQQFSNFRRIEYQGDIIENNSSSYRRPVQRNHNARLGLDYEITKATVFGILFETYDNKWSMDAENHSTRSINSVPDTSLFIVNDEINQWSNFTTNINLQHRFRETQSLAVNLNYVWYKDNNPTNYINHYYKPSNNLLFTEQTKTGKVTPISFYVASLDYTRKLSKKWDMETGVKFTFSKFTNDVRVERFKQNNWVADPEFTNKYELQEDISAAYISFSSVLNEKTSIKLGMRYEYTQSDLSTVAKNIFNREYGRLFPSFFISRKINDEKSINFSYIRRITRPTFNELAPFIIFLDPSTFFSGNSVLQPAIADGIKLDYTLKKLLFSVGYTYESNSIARFQTEVDVSTNKQYLASQNLTSKKTVTLILGLPFNITKWWTTQNNFIASWQNIHLLYKGDPVELSGLAMNITMGQTFTLPKGFAIELSGIFKAPGYSGTFELKPHYMFTPGIQKRWSSGSSLRFSITDMFDSFRWRFETDIPGQHFYTLGRYDISQRTFLLTWTSRFGKRELKDKRNRSTGSEDEKRRVE